MLEAVREKLRHDGSVTMTIRVHPGARETAVTDVMNDGTIKVSLRAKAEKGRANEELIELLADQFEVPRGNVAIISAATGRRKIVKITGVS